MKKLILTLLILCSYNIQAECKNKRMIMNYEIKNQMYDIQATLTFRCNDMRFEITKNESKRKDWINCDITQKNYDSEKFMKSEHWKKHGYLKDLHEKQNLILTKEWSGRIEFETTESEGQYFVIPIESTHHEIYCVNNYNDKEIEEYRPFKLEPTLIYIN